MNTSTNSNLVLKKPGWLALMVAAVLGASASVAWGKPIGISTGPDAFIFNFDESGNASYQVYDPTHQAYGPLTWTHGAMTLSSTSSGWALTYRLPEFVLAGDVAVFDHTGAISDGLRFSNDATSGLMRFFSVDLAGGLLADTGLPADFSGAAGPTEVSEEFTYVAGAGNPAHTNFYNDPPAAVPGPPTLLTLALGGLAVAWARRVSRRRPQRS